MRFIVLFFQSIALLAAANVAFAAEPVRIGVSLGLTGKYAELGLMHERAYLLWENEINGRGGLLGRPVAMVIRNDESDPAKAAAIYRDLIARQNVDFVFGPYSSEITSMIAPIVEKHGYPTLLPGACADELWGRGYRYLFGVLIPCSRYAVGMLILAFDEGLRTVAILHADDPFSDSVAAGVRKWAPKLELKIVTDLRFAKGKEDLTEEARRLRDAGAELLIVAGHFNEAVNARRALSTIGWMPRAYFATIGPALPRWKDVMGPLAEGAFAASIWEPSLKDPSSRSFLEKFRTGNNGLDPSYHAATAYAAGEILEKAVTRAKSLDREAVREALSKLDFYTVIGRYKVDRTGMQVRQQPVVIQWRDGLKEIVWPDDVRTSRPTFGPANK